MSAIYDWFSTYITYTNVRNVAELFYFIVLTGAMVYYAKKTYKKSVEEEPQLFVDVYVDYKDRLERGQSCYPMYLEIYNNGTGAATNIIITTDNQKLSERFSVFNQNIGFLQPGKTKYIPIGSLLMTMSDNCLSIFDDISKGDALNKTKFYIQYDGNKKEELSLNFEYALRMPHTPIGKTTEESVEEKKAKNIETISKSLASMNSSIANIDKKMKK